MGGYINGGVCTILCVALRDSLGQAWGMCVRAAHSSPNIGAFRLGEWAVIGVIAQEGFTQSLCIITFA